MRLRELEITSKLPNGYNTGPQPANQQNQSIIIIPPKGLNSSVETKKIDVQERLNHKQKKVTNFEPINQNNNEYEGFKLKPQKAQIERGKQGVNQNKDKYSHRSPNRNEKGAESYRIE